MIIHEKIQMIAKKEKMKVCPSIPIRVTSFNRPLFCSHSNQCVWFHTLHSVLHCVFIQPRSVMLFHDSTDLPYSLWLNGIPLCNCITIF